MSPNSQIQDPCFVCMAEDKLGEERGTQSHPINCGWRVKQEHHRYYLALAQVYDILTEAIEDIDRGDKPNGLEYAKELCVKAMLARAYRE